MSKFKDRLNIKKAKHKCGVRGCKNIANVYAATRTREMGRSILICRECAEMLLPSIEAFEENYIPPAPSKPRPSPFLNAWSGMPGGGPVEAPAQVDTPVQVDPPGEAFICQYCGREIGSKIGLISHEKACKNKLTE